MGKRIEKLIKELSTLNGDSFKANSVSRNGHVAYHIGANNISAIIWDKKSMHGVREELVLASLEAYSNQNGLTDVFMDNLKSSALNVGYARILANKADPVNFYLQQGFMPDDTSIQDYFLPLK